MKSATAVIFTVAMFAVLAACGDKVPESKAAKELGNVPKQTVDKAATGVDSAATQAADRLKDAEAKK